MEASRFFALSAAAAAVFGLVLSGCKPDHPEHADLTGRPREIIVHRAAGEISIDGKLDEPAWEKAPVISGFYTWDNGGLKPARNQTKVRVLWDDEHLYIAAEMEDHDLYAQYTADDEYPRLWEDDVFELFVKPLGGNAGYYEFHINPKNANAQLYWREGPRTERFRDAFYDGGLRSAVSLRGRINYPDEKDKGWTVEVAIPFSAFEAAAPAPVSGAEWMAAFCRYDYSYYLPNGENGRGRELSSSAPLSRPNFHLTEDYDRLIFLSK